MMDVYKYDSGTLRYSDDVIEKIACKAASDVEGAVCIAESAKEFVQKIGAKSIQKGVKVNFEGDEIKINVCISVDAKKNTRDTALNVQKAVKSIVENMTGFNVDCVDVYVAKIDMKGVLI